VFFIHYCTFNEDSSQIKCNLFIYICFNRNWYLSSRCCTCSCFCISLFYKRYTWFGGKFWLYYAKPFVWQGFKFCF